MSSDTGGQVMLERSSSKYLYETVTHSPCCIIFGLVVSLDVNDRVQGLRLLSICDILSSNGGCLHPALDTSASEGTSEDGFREAEGFRGTQAEPNCLPNISLPVDPNTR